MGVTRLVVSRPAALSNGADGTARTAMPKRVKTQLSTRITGPASGLTRGSVKCRHQPVAVGDVVEGNGQAPARHPVHPAVGIHRRRARP